MNLRKRLRRKLVSIVLGAVALTLGATTAAMAPLALPAGDFFCEDDARCAHLNPHEWCQDALLDTYCQYYPEDPQNPSSGEGVCNTWSSGSCPFS